MKIVFLIDHIYLHGGIEKVLAEKANYFSEILNYDVSILTTQQENLPSCYPLSNKIKLIDSSVNYNRDKSYFHFSNLKKIVFHFIKRRKILKKINPNFVILANYDFDFYWIPFIHKSSKKIKEFHNSQFSRKEEISSFVKKIVYKINCYIESKYDAIVVLNKDEQSFFKTTNTVVIPNPISIPDYKSKLDKKQVLAAGRIAPVKGFDRLIKIWKKVVEENPNWELHIYGEDYLKTQSKLEEQIKKIGLEKSILFKGISSNMTKTMLDYSMYLMTSYTESFSIVIVESFSVGIPVVAFNVPTGPRNLITNNVDGFLIENNNLDNFSKTVNNLIKDRDKRITMGVEAKKNSLNFASVNIMDKWSKLFTKLI